MTRKRQLLLPAALAALIAAGVIFQRARRSQEPAPPPRMENPAQPRLVPRKPAVREIPPVSPSDQGRVFHAGSVGEIVSVCVAAILRRDEATRDAMIAALKRESSRARSLLEGRLSRASAPEEDAALREILGRLP